MERKGDASENFIMAKLRMQLIILRLINLTNEIDLRI
jgi:hypothetical protein